jgi:hypothetical protein
MGEFGEEEGIDIRGLGDFDGSKGRYLVKAGGQLRSQWAGPPIHF